MNTTSNAQSSKSTKSDFESIQAQITATPELIKILGKKLYNNPLPVILARELLQNSRDACLRGHRKISMTIERTPATIPAIQITCDDDGCGMDRDTLLYTFLAMGKTKKAEGAVGGFGVAKIALFTADTWTCRTNRLYIDDGLRLMGNMSQRRGVKITADVETPEDRINGRINRAKLMVISSDVKNLVLNGDPVKPYRSKRTIHTNKDYTIRVAQPLKSHGLEVSNYVFYRIRGLTQYFEQLGNGENYGINILVDFDTITYKPSDDDYPFSLSREKVADRVVEQVNFAVKPLIKNVRTTRAKYSGREKAPRERTRKTARGIIVDRPKAVPLCHKQIAIFWQKVFEACKIEENAKFGLTYDGNTVAEHRTQAGQEYFLINAKYLIDAEPDLGTMDNLGFIFRFWHLAMHEASHRISSDHDENFTCAEDELAASTIATFTNAKNINDLRAYARKVQAQIRKHLWG